MAHTPLAQSHGAAPPSAAECRRKEGVCCRKFKRVRMSQGLLFTATIVMALASSAAAESYAKLSLRPSSKVPALRLALASSSEPATKMPMSRIFEGYAQQGAAAAADVCLREEGGPSVLRLRGGAKSKNHTNHNQIKKAHRNGIKRVRS
jgi:hypothetical protein